MKGFYIPAEIQRKVCEMASRNIDDLSKHQIKLLDPKHANGVIPLETGEYLSMRDI